MADPSIVSVESKSCLVCGETEVFELEAEAWFAWQHQGVHIQHAFPHLTAAQREKLISGTCPPCWNQLFLEDDD